jgi:hypothetical protein
MLTITSADFNKEFKGRYSYGPWKLCPPAKIFGEGKPIKDK